MEKSAVLRGPVLLVSAKLEPSSSMTFSKDQCSTLAPASPTNGGPSRKTPQIQLLAVAKTPPAITLLQTASSRAGKTHSEFPVDKNRAVYPGLHLGATFSSYVELTELMHKFQKAKGVHLYIRSSRKLYPAVNNLGGTLRDYNLDLMFADIYYSCTKGGRRFGRSSTSGSSSASSFSQEVRNCPFNIKLRLTRDGQRLYIRDIYPAHNHYLDRNSQPRIPHPSVGGSKLPLSDKPPVARRNETTAVANNELCEGGKRLVLLTNSSQRLLPVAALTTTTPSSISEKPTAFHAAGRTFPEAIIARRSQGVDAPPEVSPVYMSEAGFEIEPEYILGSEEKIVPDIDDENDTEKNEIKPWIKEEILDECSPSDDDGHLLRCDVDLPCSDEAFIVSRQQILETVKFCTKCGNAISQRYYSDKTDSLGIAITCERGHIVEWNLLKRTSTKVAPRQL